MIERLIESIEMIELKKRGRNAAVARATGYDVFAAQRHLRHRDIRTTMRYLGIDEQRRTSINDALIQHVDRLLNVSTVSNN
jgi:hypothetical protein